MAINIEERLEVIREKLQEKKSLEKTILDKRIEFEKKIQEQRQVFEESLQSDIDSFNVVNSEYYNFLEDNKFSVRFCDLVKEISELSGVPVKDMGLELGTTVAYWGKKNLDILVNMMNDSYARYSVVGNFIEVTISSSNWKLFDFEFCYKFKVPLALDRVQADGKILLEHCSACSSWIKEELISKIVINKNIFDVILDFNLEFFLRHDEEEYFPVNLLNQALLNCLKRYEFMKVENSQTLSRKKNKN